MPKKGPMGTKKDLFPAAPKPMLRQQDQPLAVLDSSTKSRIERMERFKGFSERNKKLKEAREKMEIKHITSRIKFPKIER